MVIDYILEALERKKEVLKYFPMNLFWKVETILENTSRQKNVLELFFFEK